MSLAQAVRSFGAGGSITDDETFARICTEMQDAAPALTRTQHQQAKALATEQRVEFILNAQAAEYDGDLEAAAAWDMQAEYARQRVEAAHLALHGRAAERLMERIVSIRVLGAVARKRVKVAFRAMANVEAERTGAW